MTAVQTCALSNYKKKKKKKKKETGRKKKKERKKSNTHFTFKKQAASTRCLYTFDTIGLKYYIVRCNVHSLTQNSQLLLFFYLYFNFPSSFCHLSQLCVLPKKGKKKKKKKKKRNIKKKNEKK